MADGGSEEPSPSSESAPSSIAEQASASSPSHQSKSKSGYLGSISDFVVSHVSSAKTGMNRNINHYFRRRSSTYDVMKVSFNYDVVVAN